MMQIIHLFLLEREQMFYSVNFEHMLKFSFHQAQLRLYYSPIRHEPWAPAGSKQRQIKKENNASKHEIHQHNLHCSLSISQCSMSDGMFENSLEFVVCTEGPPWPLVWESWTQAKQTNIHSQKLSSTRMLFCLTQFSSSLLMVLVWKSRLTAQ